MDNQLPPLPSQELNNQTQNTNVSVINNPAPNNTKKIGQNIVKYFILFMIVLIIIFVLGWGVLWLVNKLIKNNANQNISFSSNASTQQRQSDMNTIAQAIKQYYNTNHNQLPSHITETEQQIATNGADICASLLPKYLVLFPVDPEVYNGVPLNTCQYNYQTGYDVRLVNSGGVKTVEVSAPLEKGKIINTSMIL